MPRSPYKPKPRVPNITVVVQDAGPMDEKVLEAWAKRYVQVLIEVRSRRSPDCRPPASKAGAARSTTVGAVGGHGGRGSA
jgi:hypothetical protein